MLQPCMGGVRRHSRLEYARAALNDARFMRPAQDTKVLFNFSMVLLNMSLLLPVTCWRIDCLLCIIEEPEEETHYT